jgi:2-methylcitrate dehydratase PrpD
MAERSDMQRRTVLKLMTAPAAAALLGLGSWRTAAAAPGVFRDNALTPRTGPPTVSEQIASFLARVRFEDLPASVIQKAKEQIVFLLGRAFEGSLGEAGAQVHAIASLLSRPVRGSASVIGQRYRLSPADAAFANCSFMRGDSGNDDLLWPSLLHPGPITLPVALSLGEVRKASGREFILAYVLGYEVMGKLARAAIPWEAALPRRSTNVYGAFGPVTTAAHLLKLSEKQLANAMAYAVNIVIGIPEMMTHYYSLLAGNGLLAAQLAGAGGVAYGRTTIEGELGLYRSFFGSVPESLPGLIAALGSDWEILNAAQKRFFSSGGGTGANATPLFLLDQLLREEQLSADDIQRIDVVLPFADYAQERRDIVASQGPFDRTGNAYGSLPYSLALLALFGREIDAKWYANDAHLAVINDPGVARVMQRVFTTFESGHQSSRYCRLDLTTSQGRHFRKEADNVESPFPRAEWSGWLRRGARLLNDTQLETLERTIGELESVRDVSTLAAALIPAATPRSS